jgi:putative spermidine/putrescine transport system permease protein
VFLLLPVVVVAIEAFRTTDPTTFQTSWSTASIVAVTKGPYRRAYLGSLELSVITAVLGAVLGLALAVAISRTRRNLLLRRLVLTASGVLANFGGVPLAFAFLATIGNAGVLTVFLTNTLGIGLGGFSLFSMTGLALVYLYFLIPLMVLTITPALEALRPQWREASDNLGAPRTPPRTPSSAAASRWSPCRSPTRCRATSSSVRRAWARRWRSG